MSARLLVFGGGGQVGRALRDLPLPPDWQLFAPTRSECDFARDGDIARAVRDCAPDLIVNAAAMVDIDACEADHDAAIQINFDAVANIASQAVAIDAPVIQISTDYVFDGADNRAPYRTDDAMNPVNAYGQSKMLGEEAVRHGLYWHIILRTSLVFGPRPCNVLTKTLHQLATQSEVTAVGDQTANPTSADSVASAIQTMATAVLRGQSGCFGTFHVCDGPTVSRYEFLRAIADAYQPFNTNQPLLRAVEAASLTGRVPRPPHTALDMARTTEVFGIAQRPWRDALPTAIQAFLRHET